MKSSVFFDNLAKKKQSFSLRSYKSILVKYDIYILRKSFFLNISN